MPAGARRVGRRVRAVGRAWPRSRPQPADGCLSGSSFLPGLGRAERRPCPLQSTSPCPPDGGLRLQGLMLVMFLHLMCSARWRAVPPAVAWAITATALEISCQKMEGLGPSPPAAQAPACTPQGQTWAVSFWSAQMSLSHKEDGLSQKLH